jgi:hypothetical protein
MFKRLRRADLMAGEAPHAILRMDRRRYTALQFKNTHRAVLDAKPTPVAGLLIDMNLNHSHPTGWISTEGVVANARQTVSSWIIFFNDSRTLLLEIIHLIYHIPYP